VELDKGEVLSPYLFAIYIDGLVDKIRNCAFGCYIRNVCMAMLLYADDILLIATSVTSLQMLLHICDHELSCIGMSINAKKSSCLRIGQAYNQQCARLCTIDGHDITLSDSIRYLGIYIKAGKTFTCCLSHAKSSFYHAFNAVLGKVASAASEIVVIELLKFKYLPILYYGLEACPINKAQYNSLNFVLHSSFRKIFRTKSTDVVNDCMLAFNCSRAEDVILKRKLKFLANYASIGNLICYTCQTFANADIVALKC